MASLFNLNPAAATGNRPPPARPNNSTPESNMRITNRIQRLQGDAGFHLRPGQINLLIGKNKSGKSTTLSALQILEYAMRIAQARTATRVEDAKGKMTMGHHIPEANLPTSIENVHTDYTDVSTLITFTLENDNSLFLHFPRDGGCILYWEAAKPFRHLHSSGNNFHCRSALCRCSARLNRKSCCSLMKRLSVPLARQERRGTSAITCTATANVSRLPRDDRVDLARRVDCHA
jgi:ABC-type dipeptide/oligopeptide/nickel transport system ATPase component